MCDFGCALFLQTLIKTNVIQKILLNKRNWCFKLFCKDTFISYLYSAYHWSDDWLLEAPLAVTAIHVGGGGGTATGVEPGYINGNGPAVLMIMGAVFVILKCVLLQDSLNTFIVIFIRLNDLYTWVFNIIHTFAMRDIFFVHVFVHTHIYFNLLSGMHLSSYILYLCSVHTPPIFAIRFFFIPAFMLNALHYALFYIRTYLSPWFTFVHIKRAYTRAWTLNTYICPWRVFVYAYFLPYVYPTFLPTFRIRALSVKYRSP